jgi:hypothetical protein
MASENYAAWLDQLLDNLKRSGPEAAEALRFLRQHRTRVGVHEQLTGARWTIGRRIELHPRFAQGSPDDPQALSLIIHEVRHLQQGPLVALSVYGELEAWQLQFAFLKSLTGHYHYDPRRNEIIEELMSLSLGWVRSLLQQARALMQAYAGKAYRIDLLPLYPLPAEIIFRATGKGPMKHPIYKS